MLFTVWLINSYFVHNFKPKKVKFKYLIDNTVIGLRSFINFASVKDIIIKCNPTMDLWKFASNN